MVCTAHCIAWISRHCYEAASNDPDAAARRNLLQVPALEQQASALRGRVAQLEAELAQQAQQAQQAVALAEERLARAASRCVWVCGCDLCGV